MTPNGCTGSSSGGMGCRSFVPPVPRTADRTIRTPYRAKCTSLPASYGRRRHAEGFFSGLKASTGSSLKARTDPARFTEAALRVLTYAVRRVWTMFWTRQRGARATRVA
jgi:hypothetical protein